MHLIDYNKKKVGKERDLVGSCFSFRIFTPNKIRIAVIPNSVMLQRPSTITSSMSGDVMYIKPFIALKKKVIG